MKIRLVRTLLAFSALGAGCGGGAMEGPVAVRPGAPGGTGSAVTASDLAALRPVHTDADVHFMHMMIPHHAQALEITALAASRAAGDAVRQMALRMEISQRDEIAWIERWLRTRGEPLPEAHHAGMMPMPGMLTPEEMDILGAARGEDFDRIFLESMIRHHLGAVSMVQQLFATSGAGQDSEVFQFANDVETDQMIEIDRMGALLQTGAGR